MDEYAVELVGIAKAYPGVLALDGVSLRVRSGEVHALVGENGAGKSTLIKVLAGATAADAGEVRIAGRTANLAGPQDALRYGVSVIYQEFNLVPDQTVLENITIGREPLRAFGFVDRRAERRRCAALLERLGIELDLDARVRGLSIAQQQVVEIAKALSREARAIVMDEPSATLTLHELDNLFRIIRQLRGEGVAIIYISHRLEEVFAIADRVTVLRDGRWIGTHPVGETDRRALIEMMVGRSLAEEFPRRTTTVGEVCLAVEDLRRPGGAARVSFAVRRGEVVGLAGLVGSGRTELARMLFGADPIGGGTIRLDGEPLILRSPSDAIRAGICLLTEDRKGQGLVLGMTVRDNITLPTLDGFSRGGWVRRGRERQAAAQLVQDLRIKTPSVEQVTRALSGGNQQKVVLARWLAARARVILFDEPTRGIDVGAKVEIYQLINDLAARGAAIVVISSELPEVLGMSDRILVMRRGAVAGELAAADATQEAIMALATAGGEAVRA